MSKVTSKFQVTLPRQVARKHRIGPGSTIQFVSEGDSLRVLVDRDLRKDESSGVYDALQGFDEATERQDRRNREWSADRRTKPVAAGRGWSREDLYEDRLRRR